MQLRRNEPLQVVECVQALHSFNYSCFFFHLMVKKKALVSPEISKSQ